MSETGELFGQKSRRALIIANGEPPKKQHMLGLARECASVICADGGANTAMKYGLTPDVVVGDLDSIHAEALVRFHRVPTVEDRDDETTDLEKSIVWAIKSKFDHLTVVGATGRRLDHTVGNLGVLVKFFPDAIVRFVDDLGELRYVGRELALDARKGTVISLIPLNRCEGVTTSGLRYALNDEVLQLGSREGTSNVAVSTPVSVRVRRGDLLVFRLFE